MDDEKNLQDAVQTPAAEENGEQTAEKVVDQEQAEQTASPQEKDAFVLAGDDDSDDDDEMQFEIDDINSPRPGVTEANDEQMDKRDEEENKRIVESQKSQRSQRSKKSEAQKEEQK